MGNSSDIQHDFSAEMFSPPFTVGVAPRPAVWSLLDIMRAIELHQFSEKVRYLVNVSAYAGEPGESYTRKFHYLGEILKHLDSLSDLCGKSGLPMTEKVIGPLREIVVLQMNGAQVNFKAIWNGANVVAARLEDELSLREFFELEPGQAERFKNPLKDWEVIIARFPAVRQNVEESSKCFALERYGAAVFHVLQVAEYGVIEVAKLLEVEGDKPGWASLKRLQNLIKEPFSQRIALAQKHSILLENSIPLAIVVKDSWRHKLTHVDNQIVWMDTDFSPQVAEEIIAATRGFMRKLAQDLPPEKEE
jgi:hypothetical protein